MYTGCTFYDSCNCGVVTGRECEAPGRATETGPVIAATAGTYVTMVTLGMYVRHHGNTGQVRTSPW
jgi:hypothetical protein